MHSAAYLREADFKKAGNTLETGNIKQGDVLMFLRILPVLTAMPQYTLSNDTNINRFNTAVKNALQALPNKANVNQPFILATRQESKQTLSDLKNATVLPSKFIQSLQVSYGK